MISKGRDLKNCSLKFSLNCINLNNLRIEGAENAKSGRKQVIARRYKAFLDG
jgi:hypothetical protein